YNPPGSRAYSSAGVPPASHRRRSSKGFAGSKRLEAKRCMMENQSLVPEPASAFGVSIVRMPNLSDEDVMEELRKGHPDALPILFDRFYRLVLRIASRILRDPGEAEDVMQEVFLEIFNKAAQFDPAKGSAKTWILQYAYHRSLSRRQYLALRN